VLRWKNEAWRLEIYMGFNDLLDQFVGKGATASSVNYFLKETCILQGYSAAFHLTTNIPLGGHSKRFAHFLCGPLETRRFDSDEFISIDAADIYKLESGHVFLETNSNSFFSLQLRPKEFTSEFMIGIGIHGESTFFVLSSKKNEIGLRYVRHHHGQDLEAMGEIFHLSALAALNKPVRYIEHTLTSREVEVIRWSAEGMSYKEIATLLDISARTVRFFLENAKKKLNCKNTTHAVSFALQRGII
jgi:DNA-binding CsgD family transcriptional regulator